MITENNFFFILTDLTYFELCEIGPFKVVCVITV